MIPVSNASGEYGNAAGGGPSSPAPMSPKAEGDADILTTLQKDFDRLKRQKSRPSGGVEGTMLTNLCFLNNEHYVNYTQATLSMEGQEKNKLYLTFNLITPRWNKLSGRLSAFNAPFKSQPNKTDPEALESAEIADRMLIAVDQKVDEISRMRERLHWMGVAGTAFEYTPWVPNAGLELMPVFEGGQLLFKDLLNPDPNAPPVPQDQVESQVKTGRPFESFEMLEEVQPVGEVGSIIYGPANVFVDQTVKSIADLPPDAWVHVAEIKTTGWVEENFNEKVEGSKELSLIQSRINSTGESIGGTYLKDLIPMFQGTTEENDPEMVIYVCSYQASSKKNPKGRMVCWVPKQKVLHDDVNPYEEIPLVDFHWTPVTTTFWTNAYITQLIPAQRFINKRMNQLGEQANASIYSNILLGGGLKSSDIPADYPGVIENGLTEAGARNVERMMPPELPSWFLPSIELAVKMFNDAAGGADLMEESKFPGQLRGPMAVPMLQEILDTQWGPLFQHLGERLARVKQMRLNRVKQFYPASRTMHYVDRTQKDEVLEFNTEKVLRGGTTYNITVERGSILPELRSLREARVSERLAGPLAILYMDERTGRIDKSKVAADLQFGDTGREGREAQFRKLSLEIIKLLWTAQPVPPVQPFYDHGAMLDELEHAMSTTEFMKASPPIQQAFSDRWMQHSQFLQQQAQMQAQAQQGAQIQSAVAQATQMAAAKAASEAVDSTRAQMGEQAKQPTEQYIASAHAQSEGQPPGPNSAAPGARKRKVTIEDTH